MGEEARASPERFVLRLLGRRALASAPARRTCVSLLPTTSGAKPALVIRRMSGQKRQTLRKVIIMRREPSLDGLRAVAVVAVVIYHAAQRFCPGGWAGVDIFFVLSGYLITTLLATEMDRNRGIDFRKFYIRRFLRLNPALTLLLAATYLYYCLANMSIKSCGRSLCRPHI